MTKILVKRTKRSLAVVSLSSDSLISIRSPKVEDCNDTEIDLSQVAQARTAAFDRMGRQVGTRRRSMTCHYAKRCLKTAAKEQRSGTQPMQVSTSVNQLAANPRSNPATPLIDSPWMFSARFSYFAFRPVYSVSRVATGGAGCARCTPSHLSDVGKGPYRCYVAVCVTSTTSVLQ